MMKTIAGQCQKSRNIILVFQQEECGQVYRTPPTDQALQVRLFAQLP